MDFLTSMLVSTWDGAITYALPFLVVLSVLVFIHEWGHYSVARLFGVRVEVFSIGFGPELFGWDDRHGTRWKFSLIPLGGYVKMYGDTDPASAGHTEQTTDSENGPERPMTPDEKQVAFFAKPVWQRALIVAAGPAINFLFAILVLAGLYATLGKPVNLPIATGIVVQGAADQAGIMPGDRFISVNGRPIESFDDVRRAAVIGLDAPLSFVIERDGAEQSITVTPERKEIEDRFGFKHERGYLGIFGPGSGLPLARVIAVDGRPVGSASEARSALESRSISTPLITLKAEEGATPSTPESQQNPEHTEQVRVLYNPAFNELSAASPMDKTAVDETTIAAPTAAETLFLSDLHSDDRITYAPLKALWKGIVETGQITADSLEAIGQIIMGTRSAGELGGILRIGAVAGDMAERGMIALLTFTALLSINLGLINLFPIPALDGGHLAFYAAEAVKGSPLSDKFQDYALRFGFAVLIGLMLFANVNDVIQIFF